MAAINQWVEDMGSDSDDDDDDDMPAVFTGRNAIAREERHGGISCVGDGASVVSEHSGSNSTKVLSREKILNMVSDLERILTCEVRVK